MKKFFISFIACSLLCVTNAQEIVVGEPVNNSDLNEKGATYIFDMTEHDFGKISELNGDVECEFNFTNISETPVAITKVAASCGCTVPEWSKEPVAPGKQGFIKVKFNPKGLSGNFNKILVVYSESAPKRLSLRIKGSIE